MGVLKYLELKLDSYLNAKITGVIDIVRRVEKQSNKGSIFLTCTHKNARRKKSLPIKYLTFAKSQHAAKHREASHLE